MCVCHFLIHTVLVMGVSREGPGTPSPTKNVLYQRRQFVFV